jgi:hypothetical protein
LSVCVLVRRFTETTIQQVPTAGKSETTTFQILRAQN